MSLDVGMFGFVEPLGPFNSQILDFIYIDATAIIAMSGVSFSIFIR
jgi:hypothetical protein